MFWSKPSEVPGPAKVDLRGQGYRKVVQGGRQVDHEYRVSCPLQSLRFVGALGLGVALPLFARIEPFRALRPGVLKKRSTVFVARSLPVRRPQSSASDHDIPE